MLIWVNQVMILFLQQCIFVNLYKFKILGTAIEINDRLLPSMRYLLNSLKKKEHDFKDIIKIGRTHTQDAVPMSLGQEFSAFAKQVELSIERIMKTLDNIYELGTIFN